MGRTCSREPTGIRLQRCFRVIRLRCTEAWMLCCGRCLGDAADVGRKAEPWADQVTGSVVQLSGVGVAVRLTCYQNGRFRYVRIKAAQ